MQQNLPLRTIYTFLSLILLGAFALYLWGFNSGFGGNRLLASLFTSTSAVCVTGLVVADLSHDFTTVGQVLVLLLIQVGGLGLMTFSNWILLSLRGRLEAPAAIATHETFGYLPRTTTAKLLRNLVLYTLGFEAIGAALLYLLFRRQYDPAYSGWLAVFHSVSAFCNAGFSLFSDSFVAYKRDFAVNAVLMFLIVSGGIGFVAALDIGEAVAAVFKRTRRFLSLHTKVVLATTATLLGLGMITFLVFEWDNLLANEPIPARVLEALFLSVTARTAGFNTIPTGQLTNMSLLVLVLLMVIGASPGSTGGGIKTSTAAILFALVKSHLRNRTKPELYSRSLGYELVAKALAVLTLYVVVAFVAMVLLQFTEFGEVPHQHARGLFLEQLFEVISALSTVGLSTGITTKLSGFGQSVLIVCMFVGRLGPLTIAASLVGRRRRLGYEFPEGDVMIG